MVTVTDRAAKLLLEIREQTTPEADQSLRLVQAEDGFTLTYGGQETDDQVVENEGQEVLRIEGEVSRQLSGATIDAEERPEGPRLVIAAPPQEGV
jgi:Fe-S cluster assembly iron-binding protein IscA